MSTINNIAETKKKLKKDIFNLINFDYISFEVDLLYQSKHSKNKVKIFDANDLKKYISLNCSNLLANLSDFTYPQKGTFFIYFRGCYEKFDHFLSHVQRVIYYLPKNKDIINLLKKYNYILDESSYNYLKIAKNLITESLPKIKIYKPFPIQHYIDHNIFPVYTPSNVFLIDKDGNIEVQSINPSFLNFFKISFEPKDIQISNFLRILETIFKGNEDIIPVIQEIFGYCLTPLYIQPAFFFFYGSGANGKSTLISILSKIIGHRYVTSVPLSMIKPDSHAIENFARCLINASTESSNSKFDTAFLKQVSSGEPVQIEPKYRDPYVIIPVAKHIFALNKLPVVSDYTSGFWRRVYVIPFRNEFKGNQDNPYILSLLKDEWPGIAYWALQGLIRLIKNRGQFSHSESIEKARAQYLVESTSILYFVQEIIDHYVSFSELIIDKADIIEKEKYTIINVKFSDFYDSYISFCISQRFKPLSKKEAKHRLESQSELSNVSITRRSGGYEIDIYIDKEADKNEVVEINNDDPCNECKISSYSDIDALSDTEFENLFEYVGNYIHHCRLTQDICPFDQISIANASKN